jgi:hypothetical protein
VEAVATASSGAGGRRVERVATMECMRAAAQLIDFKASHLRAGFALPEVTSPPVDKVCVCVCACVCVCICMCVCTHTHTHTHTHTTPKYLSVWPSIYIYIIYVYTHTYVYIRTSLTNQNLKNKFFEVISNINFKRTFLMTLQGGTLGYPLS